MSTCNTYLHGDGDDDCGILRALALVDGHGIGQAEGAQIRVIEDVQDAVKGDGDCLLLQVDADHLPEIAVIHLLLVLVL